MTGFSAALARTQSALASVSGAGIGCGCEHADLALADLEPRKEQPRCGRSSTATGVTLPRRQDGSGSPSCAHS
jgi:hypothetical protein